MTLDMTRGRPAGLLLRFAFPLMLSSLLQQRPRETFFNTSRGQIPLLP